MGELVNLVAKRSGLSAEQAQTAIQTVLGFIKDRLPAPLASEVESLITGAAGNSGGSGGSGGMLGELGEVESMAKGLGGMFGKQP